MARRVWVRDKGITNKLDSKQQKTREFTMSASAVQCEYIYCKCLHPLPFFSLTYRVKAYLN